MAPFLSNIRGGTGSLSLLNDFGRILLREHGARFEGTEKGKRKPFPVASFFVLIYSSGLRVSEVAKLKIGDICSKRMHIRVKRRFLAGVLSKIIFYTS
jgi:integrase